jgi:zinc/manganese transport system permease protein
MKKELLFFSMLSIVVTSSVQSAGVLVVFSLLIAPSYLAIIQTIMKPLVFAWLSGSLSVLIAMYLSYIFDLPTGYSIIFILVLVTLVSVWIVEKK